MIGLALAAVSVIGFASTFVIGSALTKRAHVSPEVLSLLRFTIAGFVMLTVEAVAPRHRARLFAVSRPDWKTILWLGPVGTTLMAWFVFMGCARVSAANASMADALTPLMIFLVATVKARRLPLEQVAALVCGLVGALLVIQVLHAGGLSLSAYSLGDVYILLSAAVWGVYTVYGREVIARIGSTVFSTWTMLVGAAALAIPMTFGAFSWPRSTQAWLLVGALGLVSTLMPFWAWNAAQKFLPMSILGISAYFTPVVAVALAAVFLGEQASPLQWCGTLLVILSAVLELRSRKRATRRPPTTHY